MKKISRKYILSILLAAILLLPACNPQPDADTPSGATVTNDGAVVDDNKAVADTPPAAAPDPAMADITATELVSGMKLGWNLGNTLDALNAGASRESPPSAWETNWGNPETTPELIETVLASGINVIRIPVTWEAHMDPANNYQVEESWLNRVQEIVDYAYDAGAYVILNTHHETWNYPYGANGDQTAEIIEKLWTQIAKRFENYGERLIFEGMNEPRKVGTNVEWNGGDWEGWLLVNHYNEVFVQTIRKSGGNNPYRILMITPYAASVWGQAMQSLEIPDDDKIIVSIHAYEPYAFALQIPGRGNWNNDTANIDLIMGRLDEIFISKGIPVIIGEFGAMYKNAEGNEADRGDWAAYYTGKARAIGIPCVWWDNGAVSGSGELFGIIDRRSYEWQFPLVLEGLKKGAGIQ
ncbi:MAG: glycoside hydrolase family 5 protein [Lachnospiraceae bacterium]|jgi:endoglucanase|nr:glycoside hydrolase family 5 protein [Lachnospiraceae bacterium]